MLEAAKAIEGWTKVSELEFLYATARSMPAGARVVEVGSWKGRSTVAICEALRETVGARLWAVDTFAGDSETVQDRRAAPGPLRLPRELYARRHASRSGSR